jgi:multidrug efflux pump subunit AcrB
MEGEKMKSADWLERKKASLCILAGICAISLCVIFYQNGQGHGDSGNSFAVNIRHYGVDAREMERTVSIPLEDALSAIPGIRTVQSSSENSLSRVFARFNRSGRGQYEAVREAAQRVYETLPRSAQRPEIQSSDNSRIPVWSAAVFVSPGAADSALAGTAQLLERIVKPRLEGLEGAGEVLISGTGLREIIIKADQEKMSLLKISPNDIGAALAMNDSLFSGGGYTEQGKEIIITVDGRYAGSSLARALIPLGDGKTVELAEIARIEEQERSPDSISRLNGNKTAVISLMGSSGADLRKLSRAVKKELAAPGLALEFTILADRGAEEAAAFRSVFSAALQGACMVALTGFLLGRKKSHNGLIFNPSSFFCALAVPVICLISAAALSACGFPPDRSVLAGIAAGTGAAVDPVILCAEKLRKSRNSGEACSALAKLRGPLIAGSATTIAALLPLSSMEGKELKTIAFAIAAVTLAALVFSLSLLPPLLLWKGGYKKAVRFWPQGAALFFHRCTVIFRRLSRLGCRFLALDVRICIGRPLRILSAALLVSAAAVFALFAKGTDSGNYGSEDSCYAQVEFEGGLLAEEADRLLAVYGKSLAGMEGIKNVETAARTGAGSVLISFDPKQIRPDQVRELARENSIPGGFVFFPETPSGERYWEIKIFGDDDSKCRELAEEFARLCRTLPLVRERVLNFKDGSKKLSFLPDRRRLAESGIHFFQAAERARMGVYGPVIYKRTGPNGETDVRLKIESESPGTVLAGAGSSGPLTLESLMQSGEGIEPASIRREDRRRTASITISTKPMDPRRVKKELTKLFAGFQLPPGYSIEFDPDAIRRAEALSASCLSLLLALVFCYMVIAAINESFTLPLIILAAVPPSLAIPGLCIAAAGSPFNPAAACAFVAVSGMTVNAAVLCAGALDKSFQADVEKGMGLYRLLRKKIPALLATTCTTIAGALPFLFLREGANALVRTLSLVTALGVAASCLCSISVVPSLFCLKKRFRLCGRKIQFEVVHHEKKSF